MKRSGISLFVCLFILSSSYLFPDQEVKVYKPLSGGKYERTVTLKPVLEISDNEGDFLFNKPTFVKIANDDSIFISNNFNHQLLKFLPEGNYLGNLIKTGEGARRNAWIVFIFNSRKKASYFLWVWDKVYAVGF